MPIEYKNSDYTVEDTFDIKKRGRSFGVELDYALPGVQKIIESARTQEKVKLHDMVGFLEHPDDNYFPEIVPDLQKPVLNQKTGKMEMMIIEPSHITTKLAINGSKVSHSERFLLTNPGKVAMAMHKSNAGGWSWRVGGKNGLNGQKDVKIFGGIDFVRNANYISEGKMQMIAEHFIDDEDFKQGEVMKLLERCCEGEMETLTLNQLQQELFILELSLEKMQENASEYKSIAELGIKTRQDAMLLFKEAALDSPFPIPEDIIKIIIDGAQDDKEIKRIIECFSDISNIDTTIFPRERAEVFIDQTFVKHKGSEKDRYLERVFNGIQSGM